MNKKKSPGRLLLHILFPVIGVFLDQITKYYAVATLKGNAAIVLIPGVLELRYLENAGAAFGIMQGGKILFLIITPIVLAAVVYAQVRLPSDRKYRILSILLDCIAVGAIGNMIDRVRLDYVIDFIYIRLIDFPIFNVADMFVSISCFIGAGLLLFDKRYREEDFSFLSLRRRTSKTEEQK